MKPTNICIPTIIIRFLLLLKKFPNNIVAPAKANNAIEHNETPKIFIYLWPRVDALNFSKMGIVFKKIRIVLLVSLNFGEVKMGKYGNWS